jgi:6-phosphogluconolactonase
VDATGKCVLVANYNNGTVAALPIQADGSLGQPAVTIQHQGASVNPQRQTGPHAHFIAPDPANRFVLACDLGLDKVLVYQFDPNRASLNPNDVPFASLPPGSGPRHLVFHPNGREAYVINEMASTLAVFSYNEKQGVLSQVQIISTLPESFKGENTCAEVQIHPSGRFVYGSNRGHNSIVAFAADPKTGKLTLIGHQSTSGRTPRHFALDPSGKWLLAENEGSNSIVTFAVNAKTGKLSATGASVEAGSPACLVFAPVTSF